MTDTPTANLDLPRERIAAFCEKWKISELSLFGSVVRDQAHAFSDIDLLYRIKPGARVDAFDLLNAGRELRAIFSAYGAAPEQPNPPDEPGPERRGDDTRP